MEKLLLFPSNYIGHLTSELVCRNCQLSSQQKERGVGYREASTIACRGEQTKTSPRPTTSLGMVVLGVNLAAVLMSCTGSRTLTLQGHESLNPYELRYKEKGIACMG